MFSLSINFISGIMLGIEFYEDPEDDLKLVVIDLLIVRIMIGN